MLERDAGMRLKETGLQLKETGMRLKEIGMQLRETAMQLKETGVQVKAAHVRESQACLPRMEIVKKVQPVMLDEYCILLLPDAELREDIV